jgi:hypothetical protein
MIAYRINGKTVTKKQWNKRKGVGLDLSKKETPLGTVAYSESSPLVSEGLGRLPHQVKEYRESIRKERIHGVRVLNSGAVEITSRSGRNQLMKMLGKHDLDGGYGDQ